MEKADIQPLILAIPGWEGTYVVNEDYRPIAEALVKKYEEIAHIPVDAILFIENTKSKAMYRGRAKYAQIGKIPARWQEVLYQLAGNNICGVGQQKLFQDIMPNGIDSMEIRVRNEDDIKDSNEKRNLQIAK